jgi:hypothetical protein
MAYHEEEVGIKERERGNREISFTFVISSCKMPIRKMLNSLFHPKKIINNNKSWYV